MKSMLLCLILILGYSAQASGLKSTWVFPEPHSQTQAPKEKLCKALFAKTFTLTTKSYQAGAGGSFTPSYNQSITADRPEAFNQIADKILKSWSQIHAYTSAENITILQQRDRNLDPMRLAYFNFENEMGESIGIRIFDASDIVYRQSRPWKEVDPVTSQAPLEISKPGFQLPGRDSKKPFFALELGLLNADPGLARGTEFAFTQVAEFLDVHYNGSEFTFFGHTEKAEKLNMMVYAQTRSHQVAFFEKYGLKPIIQKLEDGSEAPIEVTPGMILIGATTKDFLHRNFGKRIFANSKGSSGKPAEINMQEMIKHNQEYLRKIDQKRMTFTNLADYYTIAQKLHYLLSVAKEDPLYSETQGQRLTIFFQLYLETINSLPESLRDQESWENLRTIILYSLTQSDPQAAYYYFYTNMIRNHSQITFDAKAEKKFFQIFPLLPSIPLPLKNHHNGKPTL